MRVFRIVCLIILGLSIKAQTLKVYEDSLLQLQKKLYSAKTDAAKMEANSLLKSTFEKALNAEHSFDYPFDSLKEIGRVYSPDKIFRIINWDVARDDGTFGYYGFIQVYDSKRKKYLVFSLTDKSSDIKSPDNTVGEAGKWYGMLYYKIIPPKGKRKKYYILFGLKGNDKLTNKKIIDALYFNPDASPRFGADLFKMEKKSPKRIIFEYSTEAVMSLKYNEEAKQIVFDHLSPSKPQFEGQYQYYGPDFSFDAFEFKKGKWVYIADIDARNGKLKKDDKYNDPKSPGKDHENKKFYAPKK